MIVGIQVYAWLRTYADPGPRVRQETRWNPVTAANPVGPDVIMTGVPVVISDDPTWPPDRWAFVEDGTVTASGYGDPYDPARSDYRSIARNTGI